MLAFDGMLLSVPLRALTAMGMAGHRPTRVSTRRRHGTTHGVCWRSTTCCCWCLYTRPPAHARARQLPPARACAQATGGAAAAAPAQHTAGPRAPCRRRQPHQRRRTHSHALRLDKEAHRGDRVLAPSSNHRMSSHENSFVCTRMRVRTGYRRCDYSSSSTNCLCSAA